jgi:hypothetical protein
MRRYCDVCNKVVTKDNYGASSVPFLYCSECWERYKRTGKMEKATAQKEGV